MLFLKHKFIHLHTFVCRNFFGISALCRHFGPKIGNIAALKSALSALEIGTQSTPQIGTLSTGTVSTVTAEWDGSTVLDLDLVHVNIVSNVLGGDAASWQRTSLYALKWCVHAGVTSDRRRTAVAPSDKGLTQSPW